MFVLFFPHVNAPVVSYQEDTSSQTPSFFKKGCLIHCIFLAIQKFYYSKWLECGLRLCFPRLSTKSDYLQLSIGRRFSSQPQRCSATRVAMILTLPLQLQSLSMLFLAGVSHVSPPEIFSKIVCGVSSCFIN